MTLKAVLTTGWPDSSDSLISALRLQEEAVRSNKEYRYALREQLNSGKEILNLERAFRRRTSGYAPIQKLLSSLLEDDAVIRCQIDAFAFAFLKGAKNYDMVMEVDDKSYQEIQKQLDLWRHAVSALTEFERLGENLPDKWAHLKDVYLALRSIVGRDSARDERRTLVVLLVTGPANSDEIKDDLRLNYSLSKRIMSGLVETGALEYRKETSQYALRLETIPVILFLIRELMGLDMLSMLETIEVRTHG